MNTHGHSADGKNPWAPLGDSAIHKHPINRHEEYGCWDWSGGLLDFLGGKFITFGADGIKPCGLQREAGPVAHELVKEDLGFHPF